MCLEANQRILCLWLPHWPIQRLVVAQPELRKRRIVLFSQDACRKQRVAAISPLAQLEGVRVGTPLTEARALLSRAAHKSCRQGKSSRFAPGKEGIASTVPGSHAAGEPFFHVFQHVPQDDLQALRSLAAELDSYSPIVGIQSGTGQPDCLFLDITGLAPLFGSEAKLAGELFGFCQSLGYLVRIGIAHTIGLAQGVAQHVTSLQSHTVILPQEQCDPAIATSPQTLAYLELPTESLRLSHDMTQTLHQLGIFRIGQLLQLPRKELFARFGNAIHTRVDQMTGELDEPVLSCSRPREFCAEQLLDHPTHHKETLAVIIGRLITQVCQQLKSSQQGALQWTIRLYGQQRLPLKLHVRLFSPTAIPDQVIQLAEMQLEQVLQPELANRKKKLRSGTDEAGSSSSKDQWITLEGRPLECNEITVTVNSCALLENRQRQLFDENPRADKQTLAHLVNRISGRLGYRNVVVPSLVSGNQPEYSYQLKPLVHAGNRQSQKKSMPMGSSHVLSRPLRMFHPPQPIEGVTLSPRQVPTPGETGEWIDAKEPSVPFLLTIDNRRFKVARYWGPERIETGWWRGSLVRRDYWKVEFKAGQQFWIYFDWKRKRWFLQGEF